ncbi:MAG TPA: DNA-processing protein DprA [Anaerolineales bacterium]|nr:DNA-processing protein DprA [Anaerolineales bacterium]
MAEHTRHWIGFNLIRGIGPARLRILLDHFGDLERAWIAPKSALRAAGLGEKLAGEVVRHRIEVDLDREWERLERLQIRTLTWRDAAYPRRLAEIDQPPPVLYVHGRFAEADLWSVAIVGTRKPTAYGRRATQEMSGFLAENGVSVVSGLARGVDTVAHRAALNAGGRTIAVLGSGLDRVYPSENGGLVEEIVRRDLGAVVSDYPLGTPPEGPNFPPRNRIISGLSLATVVVEAGIKSGALITARFAVEQGRDVLAVPGNIYGDQSAGTNRLIRDGALPYLKPEDILDVLDWARTVQYPDRVRPVPEVGLERSLHEKLGRDAKHINELSAETGVPIAELAAALTVMELKGLVEQVGGMNFVSTGD